MFPDRADDPAGISYRHYTVRDILRYHTACPDDRILSDMNIIPYDNVFQNSTIINRHIITQNDRAC